MNGRICVLVALLSVALVPSFSVHAQDHKGMVEIYGLGTQSCGAWNNARAHKSSEATENAMTSWAQGFVSAAANYSHLKESDSDGLASFLDQYCQAHPLASFYTASSHLVMALGGK